MALVLQHVRIYTATAYYAFNVNTAGWILKTFLVSPPAFCYTNAINRSGETIAT